MIVDDDEDEVKIEICLGEPIICCWLEICVGVEGSGVEGIEGGGVEGIEGSGTEGVAGSGVEGRGTRWDDDRVFLLEFFCFFCYCSSSYFELQVN